jgi:hypothetical protein
VSSKTGLPRYTIKASSATTLADKSAVFIRLRRIAFPPEAGKRSFLLAAYDLYASVVAPRRLTSNTLLVIRDKSKPLDLKEYIHIRWWILDTAILFDFQGLLAYTDPIESVFFLE